MQNEKLLEQLEEARLTMSKFSHEIRNPLSLIFCEIQMMTASHPEAASWKETEDIIENLEYVKELIQEFSQYNNAGRLSLKTASISDFLYTITEFVRPTLEYLGIAFTTDFSGNLPEIDMDSLKLRQAVTNLIRNAQEAITHNHGEIILSSRMASPSLLCISVTDNGCGIPSEHLRNLCTPFVTHKSNGTGLGLAVVKQIIEAHGGYMEIQSKPAIGTTVSLYFPLHIERRG